MMEAKELREYWEGLSLVEDWLGGGIKRERGEPDFEAASLAPPARPGIADLGALEAEARACAKCKLSQGRAKAVFGAGVDRPLVLVVGEGPGAEEDASGLPFVGPAGLLLDKMLAAINISRSTNAYITNIVKCRPPGNRDPAPDEVASCLPYLEAQVDALAPRAILCLGRSATQALTGSSEGITRLHGSWFEYRGIPLMATFHPSALLRDESYKRPAWEDLKALRERLGDAQLR